MLIIEANAQEMIQNIESLIFKLKKLKKLIITDVAEKELKKINNHGNKENLLNILKFYNAIYENRKLEDLPGYERYKGINRSIETIPCNRGAGRIAFTRRNNKILILSYLKHPNKYSYYRK